jgi:hypothetical protein
VECRDSVVFEFACAGGGGAGVVDTVGGYNTNKPDQGNKVRLTGGTDVLSRKTRFCIMLPKDGANVSVFTDQPVGSSGN